MFFSPSITEINDKSSPGVSFTMLSGFFLQEQSENRIQTAIPIHTVFFIAKKILSRRKILLKALQSIVKEL